MKNLQETGVEMKPQFALTPKGCENAKHFLKKKGVRVYPGMTGWEIVGKANKLMEELR